MMSDEHMVGTRQVVNAILQLTMNTHVYCLCQRNLSYLQGASNLVFPYLVERVPDWSITFHFG